MPTRGIPSAQLLAYLDPGSASVIVQMIVGGVAAFLMAVKLYGRRLLRVLRLRRGDATEVTASAPSDGHTR